eukprot:Skav204269  [mRNA]  locus=scaffold912:290312:290632:- [translate_table: standard]
MRDMRISDIKHTEEEDLWDLQRVCREVNKLLGQIVQVEAEIRSRTSDAEFDVFWFVPNIAAAEQNVELAKLRKQKGELEKQLEESTEKLCEALNKLSQFTFRVLMA